MSATDDHIVTTITASAFTSALSLAANGVSIVATSHDGKRAGLTVSSMCSVCAEPALLLVCVNADNEFCELADASQRFSVNILNDCQQHVSNVFAGIADDDEVNSSDLSATRPEDGDADSSTATAPDRFDSAGDWTTLTGGSPILADALVSLDCEIDTTLTRGTHRIFLGHVIDVRTTRGRPLIYTERGYAAVQLSED